MFVKIAPTILITMYTSENFIYKSKQADISFIENIFVEIPPSPLRTHPTTDRPKMCVDKNHIPAMRIVRVEKFRRRAEKYIKPR